MIDGIRILLIEDHSLIRRSLAILLKTQGALVVGEAQDGKRGIELARRLNPDVVLMDITLPDLNGIEATYKICSELPDVKVLALTMHSEEIYLKPFLESGGSGYICKSAADNDLIEAIHSIMKGKIFLSDTGVAALVETHRNKKAVPSHNPEILSSRELEVLKLVVRGYTSREIGERLNIGSSTVDTYRSRIMEKLGLEHRFELVEFAVQHQLLV